jgi:hypothetical protein
MHMSEVRVRGPLSAYGFALSIRLVLLGDRRVLVGFDVNLNLSAFF